MLTNGIFDLRRQVVHSGNVARQGQDHEALLGLSDAVNQLLTVLADSFLFSSDTPLTGD